MTLLNFVAVSHVSTRPRPMPPPIWVDRPFRKRELTVNPKPSQTLSRSGPKSLSRVKKSRGATAFAAAVGTYTVTG